MTNEEYIKSCSTEELAELFAMSEMAVMDPGVREKIIKEKYIEETVKWLKKKTILKDEVNKMDKQSIEERLVDLQNQIGGIDMTINRLTIERSLLEREIAALLKETEKHHEH